MVSSQGCISCCLNVLPVRPRSFSPARRLHFKQLDRAAYLVYWNVCLAGSPTRALRQNSCNMCFRYKTLPNWICTIYQVVLRICVNWKYQVRNELGCTTMVSGENIVHCQCATGGPCSATIVEYTNQHTVLCAKICTGFLLSPPLYLLDTWCSSGGGIQSTKFTI